MENKFYETGFDFGKTQNLPKLKEDELTTNSTFRKGQINELKAKWIDPVGSLKLVKWLIEYVNSKEEYDELQQDIAELEIITSSHSSFLKGGAARRAVN